MIKFIIQRLIAALLTLFVVATLTFFLMNIIPGGPFNTEKATPKQVAALEAKYGLDRPLHLQYFSYLGRLLRLDLGDSYKRIGYSVNDILGEKFPVSAKLGIISIAIALCVGIPTGTLAAYKRNMPTDRVIMFITTIGISVPGFVMGTLMLIFFGVFLGWLPTLGLSSWRHFIMPAVGLSLYPLCFIARLMRSSLLDVFGQDYIKTARAKGLLEKKVVFKHALRNSVIPIVTYLGPLAAAILTGGFVIERIFSIPGMGKFFVESITNRDYPLIMGATVFYSALLIMFNLLVDLMYGVIDPRIKLD